MIKQILGKSPRKPSNSFHNDSNGEGGGGVNSRATLPRFRDVPPSSDLFIEKLSMCCVVFDFRDPSKNLKEKEIKRQTLLELVDYVTSAQLKFSDVAMQELMKMVAVNLLRTFPPSLESAWNHIQLVYEILLRFVVSPMTDTQLAKKYIDNSFVLKLLDLFDSEDPREREYLKTILHRVYGKFLVHRPFIRNTINKIFERFISETEKHNGIAELLEFLGSIINGFALPLKEEHLLFLERALIPLHKPKCVSVYHQHLSYCIVQFVEKDSKLADIIIEGLVKYWPVTNSSMEVMFLGELEEVLKATQAAEFQLCMVSLFQQISRCLNSSDFQVAEKALSIWNNDHIRNLITKNHEVIMPTVFTALERNTHGHWHQAVQSLTPNARKVFDDIAGIAAISVNNSVEFTLEEIAEATDNFDLSFKIGQGGFGAVYYAELRGEKAAIKKMDMEATKQFLAELKVLTRVHHVNLVHLIGYCVEGSLFLVYEYVENGDLGQHLHGSGRDPLTWAKRLKIAVDSARGLEYIHEHTVPVYVHRDIKSANILIDQNFRAKVADFGLTKLIEVGGSSTRAMGTFGYMAPEIVYGEVSAKGDVYAFGVVLYELISAKRAVVKSKKPGGESKGLVSVFEELFKETDKEEALRKIIDPRLGDDYPFDSVYKMAELGRACTQENAKLRPSMSYIVFALSSSNWNDGNFQNKTSKPKPLKTHQTIVIDFDDVWTSKE